MVNVRLQAGVERGGFTLAPSDWKQAVSVQFLDARGETLPVTFALTETPTGEVVLAGTKDASLSGWLTPAQTQALPLGPMTVRARLVIEKDSKGWVGTAQSRDRAMTVSDDGPANDEERRRHHLDVLQFHLDRSDPASALIEADAWVAEEPKAFYTHAERGKILAQLGRDAEALGALDRAMELYAPLMAQDDYPPDFIGLRGALMLKQMKQ